MNSRLNILPDASFASLSKTLHDRLSLLAATLQPETFPTYLDPAMRHVLTSVFTDVGAHDGTVWLIDSTRKFLVPAYHVGPHADDLLAKFQHPINTGLIGMVLANEQPFVENQVYQNDRQSKVLDHMLKVQTCALMALPFYFLKACRGVVSCVKLKSAGSTEPDPPAFTAADLASLQHSVTLLSRLLEFRLLSATVGWNNE